MNAPLITSLQNARVKNAVKLRDRRGREQQGRILIEGIREVSRAIESGVEIAELFYCDTFIRDTSSQHLLARLRAAATELLPVTQAVMEKLTFGQRGEAIVAVAIPPQGTLDELLARIDKTRPLCHVVAVLERIEKPGNVGAVLRTADAAGVGALIIADGGTDLFNPNAIRASLGAIFTLPVCAATSDETLAWLRTNRFQILAARVDGASNYTAANYVPPTAIVLGSEAEGLTDRWNSGDIVPIALPMHGQIDSLNISAAAAVLFYEALRQSQQARRSP
jgi:TrmH family RNA methyltransferase